MRFFLPIVLLAAAASGEVFHFAGQQGQSSVYGVRGAVTVGVQELTGEKTALEYNGTLALEQVREGEYLAKFTQFSLGKYNKINRDINDEAFGDLKPEEQRAVKVLREQGQYEHEMQRPVKFLMQEGKVVRVEAEKEHQQWSLNIFRGIFTLLQNQARKPSTLAVPSVEYKYEDGITGNCKVQYEILSQPEEQYSHSGEVYNMTKTVDYKDCLGRPVYHHVKDVHRGCAGVCDNHKPENFLSKYEEEQTDYELKPTPGCPTNQQFHDSLITVTNVAKYNVSGGLLEGARTESTDLYRLFGGEIQVFTSLQLRLQQTQGPKIQEPQNVEHYSTLQQRLPVQEESELDIPIYALMKEHSKHQQYPEYFQKHFEAVIRELQQVQQGQQGHQQQGQGQKHGEEQQGFNTPAYMMELIQAVSGMTEEELHKTIPQAVRSQQPRSLSEEDQLRRQLWIELIGKAGSKSAVKLAVELIKNKTFTHSETRRVLQDIAGFQSYPDTDMIEQVLALCTKQEGLTGAGKATACVAAGKIISKGCDSKVYQKAQKEQQQRKQQQQQQQSNGKYESIGRSQQSQSEPESDEYEMTMGRVAIKPQLRCTPEKLQQYVERLSQALRQSTSFKQVVAYINGLSKIQKPEVLPTLIGYVNGTAPNMQQIREQGEQQGESVEFIRRVAIVSLRDIAEKYPKEINSVVRIIYQNTTEQVQTRLVAFDIWMSTEPAQWEVEKVIWVANKDSSLELTHYVYTALKAAMLADEPCKQLLAQRIRAVWTQIRPFDSRMKYSQFRSRSVYDWAENFGIRGIWKVITSNTTVLPAFTQARLEQIRGPYLKTIFGAKLLVKGGDKIWDELTGKDGLLERIAHAINGQVKTGDRQKQTEQLIEDIAQDMDWKNNDKETPKAVLFWQLLSGEVVVPIDAEYVKELKQELLQTVTKIGKQGGVSGHYLRVLVPTKAFHIEPTSMGLPIVHSTIHPMVISVRYENVKLQYKNQQGRVLPESFELTGQFKPTVLSFRQSRVFVAEEAGQKSPSVKISGIKEFTLGFNFKIGYEHGQRRLQLNIKPTFERVFHSAQCAELKLEKNTIIDEEPRAQVVDYGKCVKSLNQPIRREAQFGSRKAGMMVRLTGESHQAWSGLPIFGSKDASRNGVFGALLNRLANKGMKHHSISLYLETDKQNPMNEWSATIDVDTNIEALARMSLQQQAQGAQKIDVEYQPRRQGSLNGDLEGVIQKVKSLLQKSANGIRGTTIQEQVLVKLEGRHQGQTKNAVKIALKKVYNFDKTEQQWALAAETKQSGKTIEIFANVSHPKLGSIFEFDPTDNGQEQRMNGTFIARVQGQQEQTYRAEFHASKSEEQRRNTGLEYFEVRCLAEQKAGKVVTESCQRAIQKHNSLDHLEMTIKLPQNVHLMVKQLAKQTFSAIKYSFYSNMQSDISGRQQQQEEQMQGGQNKIRIAVTADRQYQWALLYNVRFETPRENVTLSKVRLPGFRPVQTQSTVEQRLQQVAVRGNWNDMCFIGGSGVRTYDNVPFDLSVRSGCEYVVTRDQTSGPADFTVTMKVADQDSQGKLVRVQLANTIIELEPFVSGDLEFPIRINGTQYLIDFDEPLVFNYGGSKRAFIGAFDSSEHSGSPTVVVYTQSKELIVLFNGGDTLATVAGIRYKGHLNGICGNDDNEPGHEFIGPNGQEYKHANEFIASYGIGQQCKAPAQDIKEKMMQKLDSELEQIHRQEQRRSKTNREQMRENPHFQSQPQEWRDEVEEFFHGNQRMDYDGPRTTRGPRTSHGDEDDHEYHVMRTHVSFKEGLICFSVRPVAACKAGSHKEGVLRTEQVESVCLSKSGSYAHEAMRHIRKHGTVDIAKLEEHQVERITVDVSIPKCVRR